MEYYIQERKWKQIFTFLKSIKGIHSKDEDRLRRFMEAIWYIARSGCQWRAAEKGRIRAVKDLVEKKGANVNAKDEYGYTALHEAAEENQMEVVKFLVANGADVNARNNEGITPLRDVAYEGHKEIAEFLVANGAKVNVADNKKVTPLHMAAYEGHEEIVKLLVANGADSNAADKDGDTPLHLATKNGHKWIAEFLVANGAKVITHVDDTKIAQQAGASSSNSRDLKEGCANLKTKGLNKKPTVLFQPIRPIRPIDAAIVNA
ncbi:Putative transposase IS4/IS5 family,Ankyrin repeat-containing domain,Ankyrin repeat [Cinara cedri]|uniref:Transposase IS4/IS5 family,Ankyrin repeat-containing domain,Ankyrin repeat n=1 Tax=Cinara cedri TaxID=506608 RepID=A0A5E4ML30_9HEMI|nr:Putative transposase IS4/IS5 family,Ankyrin repeat-containing domain,Ankyrin repeat [Cinara cedri]